MKNRPLNASPRQHGMALIEVLVTLVILLVGLLGLAGLSMHAQRSEMESYQRVQALVLLQDMVGRINANRKVAPCYAITTNTTNGTPFLGTGYAGTPTCTTGTAEQNAIAIQDMQGWNNLLLGAAEKTGGTANVGAMLGARGCISYDATASVYTVSVAWQGVGTSFAPTGQNCGKNLYGSEGQRRVATMTLRIANLL